MAQAIKTLLALSWDNLPLERLIMWAPDSPRQSGSARHNSHLQCALSQANVVVSLTHAHLSLFTVVPPLCYRNPMVSIDKLPEPFPPYRLIRFTCNPKDCFSQAYFVRLSRVRTPLTSSSTRLVNFCPIGLSK